MDWPRPTDASPAAAAPPPHKERTCVEQRLSWPCCALSPRTRRRLGLGGATLYGLYEGIPLTQRGSAYDQAVPDKITLFWGPLLRDFPDEAALAEEVRKTVYHEIAHYFGLEEDDLSRSSVQ